MKNALTMTVLPLCMSQVFASPYAGIEFDLEGGEVAAGALQIAYRGYFGYLKEQENGNMA